MVSTIGMTGSHPTSVQEAYLTALESADISQPAEGGSVTIEFGQSSKNSEAHSTSAAVIVSLSQQARDALDLEQVALQVVTEGSYSPATLLNAKGSAEPQAPVPRGRSFGTTSSLTSEAASGPTALPSRDQVSSMSAADWFYATTDVHSFTAGMTQEQAASFEAAYNSRTLNIQNASDIPQLDYKASFTYSGTATGTGGTDTVSMNCSWAAQQYGPNCIVQSDPLYGGILVSWGTQPSNGA